MIDPTTVSRIIETAEILDVVQDFVTLKKRGVNFLGLCPFHNEKTPSFTVSPSKGIFKCFGCGKGGNSVSFIMEHEHLSYAEALKFLARKYNIEVDEREETPEDVEKRNVVESLLVVSSFAQKYFTDYLWNKEEGISVGLSYMKERGLQDHIINKFQLGYCPDGWETFSKNALLEAYKKEFLVKSGLSIEKDNRLIDRFSARVMFPIHSLSGNVIGFGGRTLKSDKNIAKYLNSPESEIYHKSRVLYGLFFAKKSIVQSDKCYLVEGYTDVISLAQSGIDNVVASSGTALTPDQIRLIKRFTKNITIIYDGDEAGIKASLRGIDLVLEEGMNVKIVMLPEGEDPDSFARKNNSAAIREFIDKNEADFVLYKAGILMKDAGNDPFKRAGIITEIVRSIGAIPDRIAQQVYTRECGNLLSIDEQTLVREVQKIRNQRMGKLPPLQVQEIIKPSTDDNYYEKEIIRLLLNYSSRVLHTLGEEETGDESSVTVGDYIISELDQDEIQPQHQLYFRIYEEFKRFYIEGIIPDEKIFTNHPDVEISRVAVDLLSSPYDLSRIWKRHDVWVETEEDKLRELVPQTVLAFKNLQVKKALRETEQMIKSCRNNPDLDENELLMRHKRLNEVHKALNKKLGDRIFF
jgi:DNA primase